MRRVRTLEQLATERTTDNRKGKKTSALLSADRNSRAAILKQNTRQTDCRGKFKLNYYKYSLQHHMTNTSHVVQQNTINVTGLQHRQLLVGLPGRNVTRATFRNNTNFGMICSYPLKQTSIHNLNFKLATLHTGHQEAQLSGSAQSW